MLHVPALPILYQNFTVNECFTDVCWPVAAHKYFQLPIHLLASMFCTLTLLSGTQIAHN